MSTEPTKQKPVKKSFKSSYLSFAKAAQVPSPQVGTVRVDDAKVIGWGKDNLYPNQLINMYLESPLHGGIINGKVHFLVSGGLNYQGADAQKWELINKNYESDYTVEDLSPELARDLELFNGFAVRCKKRAGEDGSYIVEHVSFDTMRLAETGEDYEGPAIWYIYDDWSNQQKARKNSEKLEEFNPKAPQDEFVYVYMTKAKRPKERMLRGGKLVDTPYPFPPYNSGLRAILTDIEIAKFDLGEAQNGFTVGTVLHFSDGIPDEEERKDFEASLEDRTQGGENAGGVLTTYSDGDSRKPLTVESMMGNNQPDRYNNKIKVVEDRILQSHSVTSGLLFGIKTAGQLGGTEELETSYAIMKTNYFEAKRRLLCDFYMSLFKELYKLQGELDFADVVIGTPSQENKEQVDIARSAFQKFSDDESTNIVKMLSECGRPATDFPVKHKEVVYDPDKLEATEAQLFDQFAVKHQFADLNEQQSMVLGLIREGNAFGDIRAALDINSIELGAIYNELADLGLLDIDTGELTEEGQQDGDEASPGIEILYSYGKRPDVEGPDILPGGRTRDFCEQLIQLNRLYTREEIQTISARADRNVWLFKGGWYHNPDTGQNEPFCRHTWYQNVVEKQ